VCRNHNRHPPPLAPCWRGQGLVGRAYPAARHNGIRRLQAIYCLLRPVVVGSGILANGNVHICLPMPTTFNQHRFEIVGVDASRPDGREFYRALPRRRPRYHCPHHERAAPDTGTPQSDTALPAGIAHHAPLRLLRVESHFVPKGERTVTNWARLPKS
jgi:hypothetical protein